MSSQPPEPTSYTSMATVGDVEAIGRHCQAEIGDFRCNYLDFLPFRCESCKGTFCLNHRSETSHQCKHEGEWARRRREAELQASGKQIPAQRLGLSARHQKCYIENCKPDTKTEYTISTCESCRQSYCLKHRYPEEHDCAKVKAMTARTNVLQQQREKGFAALEKLRLWGASKKNAASAAANKSTTGFMSKTQSRTAQTAAARTRTTNEIKRTKVGDPKIPDDKKIFLRVEASADTTTAKHPTKDIFFSKEWSVGRVLDYAAKTLQVQNVNNRNDKEEDRLRVFHVEGGRLLEFSEKIAQNCQSGNTIVLLRGVGPPVPDLIEV